MRRTAVEMGTLAALLLGAALAYGQEAAPAAGTPPAAGADKPKDAPAKSKLEEMLQQALQNNPDLRLAAAKVAEAEAELNRARLLVVQKVGAAYQAIEAQKAAVESAAAELEEAKMASNTGSVAEATLRAAAQGKLIDAKAKLAALETELPYLLGKQPANNTAYPTIPAGAIHYAESPDLSGINLGRGALGVTGRSYDPPADADGRKPAPIVGPTADRIRAALDKPFSLELKKAKLSAVVAEVSAAFQKANPGLLIKCNFTLDQLDSQEMVSVQFDAMPFGAILVWIEDSVSGGRVAVRDYGLVIGSEEGLPPGAPTLHDFWKAGEDHSSNPPAKHVEGVVKSVGSDVVQISIGSDDGLAMGNTLWVYRLNVKALAQSKYLGRIKIVGLDAKSAIGEPMGKMAGPIQEGDHVYSRILGD
jgi:hypothetical protein